MGSLRRTVSRRTGILLNALAIVLLVTGAAVGWVLPHVMPLGTPIQFAQPLTGSHIDTSAYLGADITGLAVLIAVVIGFNITVLQIAGQAHSLRMIRGILATLLPFLLTWCVATGVALTSFLIPLVYVGQLWQQLAWFGAVVLLMIAYLWDLPWRLSGDYVALWAIRGLRGNPVAEWESIEGYSALQTAVAAAGARGDVGSLRALALRLSRFLVTTHDRKAELTDAYNRGRYRALKSLLSGCAQGAATAPSAFAYYIGYVMAGVLLQAVAGGHPTDDPEHELLSGVLRALRSNHENINPLWTGVRHALCRPADHSMPFLLTYWLAHNDWPADDPRRVTRISGGLARFLQACSAQMYATDEQRGNDNQVGEMAIDLYRDIAMYLGPAGAHARHRSTTTRLSDLPLTLLDDFHTQLMRSWPTDTIASGTRIDVVNAYEAFRARLGAVVTRVAV
jgi:hypothetical protein